MRQEKKFYQTVLKIAVPITLQSLLQSSFSVVDQVMTGQLGSSSIAGIGLGSKFASVFSVLASAVGTVAGIMIAQYIGKKDQREVSRSFFVNFFLAIGIAVVFSLLCGIFPEQIMNLYTSETETGRIAAEYLRILAASYLPMAVSMLLSTLLRCMEAASLPLYASMFAAAANTGLNYVLIFGKLGFPGMGARGAAAATVISQILGCGMIFLLYLRDSRRQGRKLQVVFRLDKRGRSQYIKILMPILICEFLWSLGENVYTAIYGHLGTGPCAAMTLTIPIQVLSIGALTGVSQAAGIIVGKALGSREYDRAYWEAKRLMLYGFAGSLLLSVLLVVLRGYYVRIYQVEEQVKHVTQQILAVFAVISPVKVQNMILGGGIIRSGGKTNYIMWIDFIGTWIFGVPLGLMAAFVWNLPIPWVYFILSLEECVRLGISWLVFRKKNWMKSLE